MVVLGWSKAVGLFAPTVMASETSCDDVTVMDSSFPTAGRVRELREVWSSLVVQTVHPILIEFLRWGDCDGLSCELLIKVSGVCLRRHLRLERRNELFIVDILPVNTREKTVSHYFFSIIWPSSEPFVRIFEEQARQQGLCVS